jgi:MMP 1-O-methyltransferase
VPVRRVGTWKDALRRGADAAVALLLPGGGSLAPVLAQVDGYLDPHEAVFLYHVAREGAGGGEVVEIGSFRGRSTLCLALGCRRRGEGRVRAVDPHVYGTAAELRANADHFGLGAWVELEVTTSVEAASRSRRPARLIFIDGNHSHESVAADVAAWLPRLEPGGFLLLHDSADWSPFPGPRRVAAEVLRAGATFDRVGRIGSISWGRRSGGARDYRPPEYGKRLLDPLLRARRGGAATQEGT